MTQTEVTKQEMQRQHAAANQKDPLVLACGRFLTSTVENNASMNRQPHESLSSFADCQPSTIRADIYVKRIMRYGGCSPSTLVLGLLYVERLKRKLLHVWITKQNIQRLFLVAVMEAVKHWEDFYYSNEHWAKIGGLTLKELNALEVEFLNLMNWELYVPADEYEALSASILEWQPLPKVVPQIEAEAKEDGDMSKVPRCLWDSCKTSAQTEPSSPTSEQPQHPADSPTSRPATSSSPKAQHPSPSKAGPLSSSSSYSALSEATTPRHFDSPQSCEQQTENTTVQMWGQAFNVVA